MADKSPKSPFAPMPPRKGPGSGPSSARPISGRDAGSTTDLNSADLSDFFASGGPAPARPDELMHDQATTVAGGDMFDSGNATRVVEAPNFGAIGQGIPQGRSNLVESSGWRNAAPVNEAPTLTPAAFAAQVGHLPLDSGDSTRVLPSLDQVQNYAAQQGYAYPDPNAYGDPNQGMMNPGMYGNAAPMIDPSMMGGMMGGMPNMPVPAEYGLVPAGQGPQAAPDAQGNYSWLRVNAPEHVGQVSPDLVMMTHPDGFAASQFRAIRQRLEQETNTQIIVVTSAREGDGKSVTAANLALALAEGGRIQVLLIDASLRSPSQHKLFGISGEMGLTNVLAARQDNPDLPIDVIGITRSLCLIPAGPPVASAHAALSSEAAAVLMGHIRREFRYIIVDSASVFGTAETLAWNGLIDKYVLVARAGKSTTEDLTNVCARLQRDRILGVTFVGAKTRRK